MKPWSTPLIIIRMALVFLTCGLTSPRADAQTLFTWETLPPLPNPLGVAGPFAGVHGDALLIAGGANFPLPVWESDKTWHAQIFVLTPRGTGYQWKNAGKLPQPLAYGSAISIPDGLPIPAGVLCIGGNNSAETSDAVFLLQWDAASESIVTTDYPRLPQPCAYSAAARIGTTVYLAGGQTDHDLASATGQLWSLDLSLQATAAEFQWRVCPPCPGPPRAYHLAIHQHNGRHDCLYVISGRFQQAETVHFLQDVWEYTPLTQQWRQRRDAPRCVMAGTAAGIAKNQIAVLSGADGSLFFQADVLRDQHPGFIKRALVYDTLTDTWSDGGPTPANHVTTIAVQWKDAIIIPSGEIRPRVRSPNVYRVTPSSSRPISDSKQP